MRPFLVLFTSLYHKVPVPVNPSVSTIKRDFTMCLFCVEVICRVIPSESILGCSTKSSEVPSRFPVLFGSTETSLLFRPPGRRSVHRTTCP